MVRETILFLAEAATLAHVARPWTLARSLDPTRYRVVFAVDSRFDRLFDFSGMERLPLDSISCERFLQALAQGSPLYDSATLERYVKADLLLLEGVRPDLVVGDFRLSLSVSARLHSIPYATISNIYWSPFVEQRYPIPQLPLTRILGVGAAQWVFDFVRPIVFGLHTIPLNRVRRRHRLPHLGWDLRTTYTDADYVLYADLPELAVYRPLPANHRFLGPIIWEPEAAKPTWWDRLDADIPVVYVTLGSSGDKRLLPQILQAFQDMELQVVVATAGAMPGGQIPANVFCAEYLSGAQAAARSSVVICNGGSPTAYQAMAAGVPVIGIPTNLDQFLNMSALQRKGVAKLIRGDVFSSEKLHQTISEILADSSYARRSRELKQAIERMPPAEIFSQFVATVI